MENDGNDGNYLLEPIVLIDDNIDIGTQEKTDEEISLYSDKNSKNLPPTRSPSSVWQHYEKIFDDNGNCINIKCKYCDQKYSSKSSTTTLNDHWKRKHSKVQPGGTGSIEAAFSNSQLHVTSARLQKEKYLENLNDLVNWVIADCQSFRVVDGSHFRKFVAGLNSGFQIPSRQTLRRKIDDKYEQYKNNIIKAFQVNY
jgi:hypothetical protein